jgi:hypothetical protein
MKLYLLLVTLVLTISARAQLSEPKLKSYARHIAERNAHLIKCDSIIPALEVVYFNFLREVFLNKQKNSGYIRLVRLRQIHQYYHKEILSFLKGKPKRIYRKLWRNTGNILLFKRQPDSAFAYCNK